MDITNFITWFIQEIINLISNCFIILYNITFYNISLLEYIISLLVLGVIIEILFTLVSSNGLNSSREYMRRENIKAEKQNRKKGN